MAAFTDFTNILPDPNNKIGSAGQASATGSAGAGFASVTLSSIAPIMRTRTNSGRLTSRSAAYHMWNISIQYNPMTRAEFDPIYSFLLEKQGSLKPFYVSLPQYLAGATNTTTAQARSAGSTSILAVSTNVSVGDMFNIRGVDANHEKAYKVTRIETTADYRTANGAPPSGQIRIHFTPPLQKSVESGASVELANPLVKVISNSDATEYSLNTENLYSFSLQLEEASY